MQNPAI